jgi:serine/threonine-protein kinase
MQHPPDSDPILGRVLEGRYRVESPLGGGGFGAVYLATHLRLQRAVAVKVLHPEHVRNPELRKRFEREAKSLAALQHPNVVTILDYGVDDDLPFLAMELLEGEPLAVAIGRGLSYERAIAIAIDVANALAYAHAQGIVHRDLKPANIFLQRIPDGGELVRVLDFGLAKFVHTRDDNTLTQGGSLMGTPAYMAPEQAMGERVDARADVYTLGLVLYEMVTGREPYTGDAVELIRHQLETPLPAIAPAFPGASWAPALDAVLARATAKPRGERYLDGAAFREALYALEGAPTRASGPDGPGSGKRTGPVAHAPTVAALPARGRGLRWPWLALATLLGASLAIAGFFVVDAARQGAEREPILLGAGAGTARDDHPDASTAALLDVGAPDASEALDASEPADTSASPTTELTVGGLPEEDAGGAVAEVELDPWSRGVPPTLRPYRERTSTRALSRRDRARLMRWIRQNPGDSRGPLAWGHALMSQGARTEALARYREALAMEPAARLDARLRTNLLRIAAYDAGSRDGADLAAELYGPSLVPDLDAFLATLDTAAPDGRRAAQRLQALRARVTR